MRSGKIVPIVTTDDLSAAKSFYLRHFDFQVVFENEGYLALRAPGEAEAELSFMLPDEEDQPLFPGGGLTYCLEVEDVDAEHSRLTGEGLPVVRPLQDNPWGDRSFVVTDPTGVALYIHQPIEPAEEFKKHFHEHAPS
jgi:uncharacterized glyoxalase superfamily protein PhnB